MPCFSRPRSWLDRPTRASPASLSALEAKSAHYADVAKQIWGFAELGYQEYKSSALLRRELATAGFKVDSGVAGMPTAFIANYGSGKPVIAIVGEFDALPGLSQDALPDKKPLLDGGPGHGCGHHLFGTASVGVGDRRERVDDREQDRRHVALLRNAGRGRRVGQSVHGA